MRPARSFVACLLAWKNGTGPRLQSRPRETLRPALESTQVQSLIDVYKRTPYLREFPIHTLGAGQPSPHTPQNAPMDTLVHTQNKVDSAGSPEASPVDSADSTSTTSLSTVGSASAISSAPAAGCSAASGCSAAAGCSAACKHTQRSGLGRCLDQGLRNTQEMPLYYV